MLTDDQLVLHKLQPVLEVPQTELLLLLLLRCLERVYCSLQSETNKHRICVCV
jgi:hypothetical protein